MIPSIGDAAAAAKALLLTVAPSVNVYVGLDAAAPNPPLDPDKRVHVYAVIYPGAGLPTQARLAAGADGIDWAFQVTCVGGDITRALACIDKVHGLEGLRLAGDGWGSSPLTSLLDPGPVQEDRGASPSRWFAPLQFGTHLSFSTEP